MSKVKENVIINIGKKIYVNDCIGEVMILDMSKDYLILFNPDTKKFIRVTGYEVQYRLVWDGEEYYNSLEELIKGGGIDEL